MMELTGYIIKIFLILFTLGLIVTLWARLEKPTCKGKFDENSPEGERIKKLLKK